MNCKPLSKVKRVADKDYLKWVKSLPCVVTGRNGVDAHHIIGEGDGGMGTTASDFDTFPLVRSKHTELHSVGVEAWESIYGKQKEFVKQTQGKWTARNSGEHYIERDIEAANNDDEYYCCDHEYEESYSD